MLISGRPARARVPRTPTAVAFDRGAVSAPNPYRDRFFNFLKWCVWTRDEAGGGEVRSFPTGYGKDGKDWSQIWLELEDEYLREPRVFVEKSRRVLVSWFTCAFDVWLAAGGQDPRWLDEAGEPVLTRSAGNRQVVLMAQKAQGPGGSYWFLDKRIKCILTEFERHDGRALWPDFPRWKAKRDEISFSNGSFITGLAQGKDQYRGLGSTVLHCEEVAFWEYAEQCIGAALHTGRGGGHMVCISTAQVDTYAARLVSGEL